MIDEMCGGEGVCKGPLGTWAADLPRAKRVKGTVG